MTDTKEENPHHISWHDSAWIPHLNANNVLDYFSERSNPFYDRTCNNEIIKMQKQGLDRLQQMQGLEYILLHVQEPILFVIRKQHRFSPTTVTPIADYYIIAGHVYLAPDLNTVMSSRLTSSIHYLQSAFDEAYSYMTYHPTKGYGWDFSKDGSKDEFQKQADKKKEKLKMEKASSEFQRARVDLLLGELLKKFPPKVPQAQQQQPPEQQQNDQAIKQQPNGTSSASGQSAEQATNGSIDDGGTSKRIGEKQPEKMDYQNGGGTSSNSNNNNTANAAPSSQRNISGIPEKKPRFT